MSLIRYQIARSGQILGAFGAAELAEKIKSGAIIPSDSYWTEGMAEWKAVSEYQPSPAVGSRPPTVPVGAPGWKCDSCRSVFQAPASTTNGDRQIFHACWFLAGAVILWMAIFGALNIPAEAYQQMKLDPVVALFGALFALPVWGWLLWKTVTILVPGLIAKGLHVYQGAKSSCPSCGSSHIAKV